MTTKNGQLADRIFYDESSLTSLFAACEPDESLDYLTLEAAVAFKVPIAMVNLISPRHIIFKSCVGNTRGDRMTHKGAFCHEAVGQIAPYIVADTEKDEIFKNSPLVLGPMRIRSYIGKSLHTNTGRPIGTFCLMDTKVRSYSRNDITLLYSFAEAAERHLQNLLPNLSS